MKYNVEFMLVCSYEVEAEDDLEAEDKAFDIFLEKDMPNYRNQDRIEIIETSVDEIKEREE